MAVRLPRNGCAIHKDGTILWGWSHNDPTSEFESFPPRIYSANGEFIRFVLPPDHEILDLEGHLTPKEMKVLCDEHRSMRWRKHTDGSFRLKAVVEGPDGPTEVDHHIQIAIDLRKGTK